MALKLVALGRYTYCWCISCSEILFFFHLLSFALHLFCLSLFCFFIFHFLCLMWVWSFVFLRKGWWQFKNNSLLRRIFGCKRDEVTRGWRQLHNGELHNLYSSQIKKDEIGVACGTNRGYDKCIHFIRKILSKYKLRRHRNRWEDNIKIYFEMGCEDVDWIHQPRSRDHGGLLWILIFGFHKE
jgi:hypothetical protein